MGNGRLRILNRDVIKYFAMATMLMNHIATLFMRSTIFSRLLGGIGGFTAVTMCCFLVDGYGYTRSRARYALRLAIFALISQFPFSLAISEGKEISFGYFNMLFSLLLCFLLLLTTEKVSNIFLKIIIYAVLTAVSIVCDWFFLAPIFTLLFFWAKDSSTRLKTAYIVSSLATFASSVYMGIKAYPLPTNLFYALLDTTGIILSGIVIIYLYNGRQCEKGRKFSKWFFYIFYPAHLLILGSIRYFLA